MNDTDWVVACGGTEPIMVVNGRRYQYMWNRKATCGRDSHAYYCFETDVFLTDSEWDAVREVRNVPTRSKR